MIGVGEEHEAFHEAARGLLARSCPPAVPRSLLDAPDETLPSFWGEVAGAGWLGLHVDEEYGGSGYGLPEVAVVLEELGRAAAPGPFLPTALAAAVISACADADARKELLPGLVDGSVPAAVAFASPPVRAEVASDDGLRLSGTAEPVMGGAPARLLLVPAATRDREVWCALDASDVFVRPLGSLDATRRCAAVDLDGTLVPSQRQLGVSTDELRDLATVLLAAEACGLAGWCLDTAAAYARVREQFGRPIGAFQAIKHRCADLLVAVEEARAVTWDAARAKVGSEQGGLAAAVAGALVPDVAVRAAKDCVQILGGTGFTWEHDAHIYLKRAVSVRQLLGDTGRSRDRVVRLALAGVRRDLGLDLPEEASRYREEVRRFLAELDGTPGEQRRRRLVDAGYLMPHWPRPWGRAAGPVEQVVIDEGFRRAGVRRPNLAIGAWVVPTLMAYGTTEQQERWIKPTLHGELVWCQLFSEPGAGSDLAGITSRAERADGGWRVTGQKVWTSVANEATHAILLARTGSGTPENRRAGITYFLLDMRSAGVDVRPLREITGHALFNEVFLDGAFVPDDAVVGEVGNGWEVVRATLANERVQIGTGSSFGVGVENLLDAARPVAEHDPVLRDRLGGLLVEAQAHALLGHRQTLRALVGGDPGAEASVRKLVGAEHEQRVQEFGLEVLGSAGALTEGPGGQWGEGFLVTRCLTIAGGTSEIQRNVIAERLLGLPRDP